MFKASLFNPTETLYLCAPGAAKLFEPCALSFNVASCSGVITSSITSNPIRAVTVLVNLPTYKCNSGFFTKYPFA